MAYRKSSGRVRPIFVAAVLVAGGAAMAGGVAGCSGSDEKEDEVVVLEEDGGGTGADADAEGGSADTGQTIDEDGGSGGDAGADGGEADTGMESDSGGTACPADGCPKGTECDEAAGACRVMVEGASCQGDAAWDGQATLFEDVSDAWKLADMKARGIRLTAVDFDGDGWADLAVRKGGGKRNTFGEGAGKRAFWLLRNVKGKRFEDVTKSSGILKRRGGEKGSRMAEILAWADVDNDGDMDVYTGWTRANPKADDTAEILLNQGDGTFKLGPKDNAIRRVGQIDAAASASFVDYDRDGNVDLWVAQYAGGRQPALQDLLYRGKGDGSFELVNEKVGVKSFPWQGYRTLNAGRGHSRAWSGLTCDVNDDGTPELMAASYGRAPNHLWQAKRSSDGQVSYENVSVDSGYAFDDRMDWTDNASARCHCKLNPDAPDCEGVPEPQRIQCNDSGDVFRWRHGSDREPFRLGGNSGTTVCADIDTDGRMDLLTTEIVHWDVGSSSDPSEILYNRGEGAAVKFERPGNETTGLTRTHKLRAWNDGDITAGVFDVDNDARPDIYIGSTDYPGTRGHLWRQTKDGTFQKVPDGPGIDHTSSHGIGLADFDRDGDVDIAVGHSRFRCGRGDHCYPKDDSHVRLFENKVGQAGNWVQVELAGRQGANRSATGARVEVVTERGTQTKEVDGGHGHYGIQHEQALHFGLGGACEARVTVRWPDAGLSEQSFVLKSGVRYRWEQGGVPTPVDGAGTQE